MKSKMLFWLACAAAIFLPTYKALAVCPVCTVAVGAGIGLSRWLGIDDAITGLWLGGFLLSISLWTIDWLNRKNIRFFMKRAVVILAYYAFAIIPLYYAKILTDPVAFVCSCANDKLLVGIIEGTAVFYFATTFYEYVKARNGGRAHFPFEKIAFPVISLVIFTILFYLLSK